jgi:hypothetical protein
MSAPIIKFKRTGDKIERVECVRESEASVWVAHLSHFGGKPSEPSRVAKNTSYESYHDTWAEAHALLVRRAESAVLGARRNLELANAKLGNIKGMKPRAA